MILDLKKCFKDFFHKKYRYDIAELHANDLFKHVNEFIDYQLKSIRYIEDGKPVTKEMEENRLELLKLFKWMINEID